jgi:hypothetical protein
MDDRLVRNDTTYISTSLAADLTDYSQDYVGQLARDGHIESVKVGHKRFVGRDDVISYALDSKSDLSIADIPENHRPEAEESSEPVEERESSQSSESSSSEPDTGAEPETPGAEAIVIPDEEMGADQASSQQYRRSETAVNEGQPSDENFAVSDRANSRWQKSRDGHRRHADASVPAESESRVPMVVAALLAIVVSFGLWVGPASNADETVGRVAHNISVASQSAYTALGYGLDQQLQQHGPTGTVANSLTETAQLAMSPLTRSQTAQLEDASASGSKQVAAAGSTAKSFTYRIKAFGQSIANNASWLTQPITFNQLSFRDYYQRPNRVVSAETSIDTAVQDQSDSDYSPENTQVDQPEQGVVVVPAPNSAAAREATRQRIRSQFSDPVEVTASTSNSGIIQPRFNERRGDQYMYVMVPTNSSSSASTTARE